MKCTDAVCTGNMPARNYNTIAAGLNRIFAAACTAAVDGGAAPVVDMKQQCNSTVGAAGEARLSAKCARFCETYAALALAEVAIRNSSSFNHTSTSGCIVALKRAGPQNHCSNDVPTLLANLPTTAPEIKSAVIFADITSATYVQRRVGMYAEAVAQAGKVVTEQVEACVADGCTMDEMSAFMAIQSDDEAYVERASAMLLALERDQLGSDAAVDSGGATRAPPFRRTLLVSVLLICVGLRGFS